MTKKVPEPASGYDPRSGLGDGSVVPAEIRGWSWGAFSLSFIWGICHGVWISLLVLVPLVGVFFIFYLGAKGKQLAWQHMPWKSIEEFNAVQKKWNRWGVVVFIISVVIPCIIAAYAAYTLVTMSSAMPSS